VPKPSDKSSSLLPAMTMEEIANESNLKRAFKRVAANKGAPGPDRQTTDQVRERLGEIVSVLRTELLKGNFRPGMIRRAWIPKPSGGQRGLGIPNVIDRLVQQAISQVLSPHFEFDFHDSSHGFRPGRSCHTAIAEARKHVQDGYRWVVDIDLEKFFDRVNHQRLLARLAQRIEDRRLLRLIGRMLKAKVVMPDGVVLSNEEGTPQGGPLSPLLSNLVLDELDWELEQRGHRFVRYADDCNIYVRSERAGQRVMASIRRYLVRRLRLRVNETKSAVDQPEKRHFVGFRLRWNPEEETVEVLLSKRSKTRLAARIRELTPRTWGNSLRACIHRVNEYLRGWISFFGICTAADRRTLSSTDAHIRRRLRAIRLKQWGSRSRKLIIRHLVRLGVSRDAAKGCLYSGRRSWWHLSHTWAVDRALRNEWFARQGLVSVELLWLNRQDPAILAPELHLLMHPG
jgi:group II intron reverse transcriptase/maturase